MPLCPICHAESGAGASIGDPVRRAHLYRCSQCTHCFTLLPQEEEEQYDDRYYTETHKHWFAHPQTRLFASILLRLEQEGRNDLSVLDVGCGKGDLLRYIHERAPAMQLTGIDLTTNEDAAIRFIRGDIYNATFDHSFDAVCSLATVEHIRDPHGFMQILHAFLAPDGLLIMMTVDSGSLLYRTAAILRKIGMTAAYDRLFSLHHLQHFNRASLRRLCDMHGFDVVAQSGYSQPVRAADVPRAGFPLEQLYRLAVAMIFFVSRICRNGELQTVVCRKSPGTNRHFSDTLCAMTQDQAATHWQQRARSELKAARILFEEGEDDLHGEVIFHCHLALELALKARYIKEHDAAAPFTHKLAEIAHLLEEEWSERDYSDFDELSDSAVLARYGDVTWQEQYATKARAEMWLEKVGRFISRIQP